MEDRVGEDLVRHSLGVIGDELQALLSGSARLRAIYGEAALASDLTFVKILEDQYRKLSEDVAALTAVVNQAKAGFLETKREAIAHGG